jgi:hypothetical protein
VSWTDLDGFGFGEIDDRQKRARAWLFASFAMAFSGIIAAVWIAVVNWFNSQVPDHSDWPAIALILQNVGIFSRCGL